MLTNPLPHNQNMNSRSHDQSSGNQDPSEGSGHGCINMVRAAKVVTRAKYYGLSQPNPRKGTLEEISTQNGPFNFYSNSMSLCVSQ